MMHLINNLKCSARGFGILLALCVLLLTPGAYAQVQRTLQSVDFASLGGDRVLLTLTLSAPAPEPVVFTIEQPARLSLDLPDTRLAMNDHYQKIGLGKVEAVAEAEGKNRTRVVVEMASLLTHSVRVDGNKVLLELGGGQPPVAAPVPAGSAAPVSVFASATPPESARRSTARISAVDFRRGESGEGRIIVTLDDESTPVDVRQEGSAVIARFRNTRVPDALLKRLDVLDFATPVKFVDTRRDGNNAEITVTPIEKAQFEQVAYQTGNTFTLELQPLTQEKIEERKRAQPEYTGQRISLSFQSIDIRSLLQIIADVAGTNMVVSDSVSGNIALRLQNVPWDQALDIILRIKGLGMQRQGNVMMVAPLTEIAEREKVELETLKQKADLEPLRTETIQLNYAKAADMRLLFFPTSGGGAGGTAKGATLLSSRGHLSIDERTNTLVVQDTPEKLTEIRALIAKLDVPVRQVQIDSRIVLANESFDKELGTRFGVTAISRNGSNGLITTSGTAAGDETMIGQHLAGGAIVPPLGNFNVNLPTLTPGGSFGLAILGSNYLVDLELSAIQTEGYGHVVANPRVITANGKQAEIEQGQQIPYQTASGNLGTQTQFVEASLILTVTPHITPDNRVLMDLSVKDDALGANVSTGVGSAPAIDTRRVTTQVLVKTGETVVLGGVYTNDVERNVSKIPFLGDLPLIGRLFRFDQKTITKRELLIFVTPKILDQGLQVN